MVPSFDENWWERQNEGISVAKSQSAYRGRKAGATKAQVEDAVKLREKGLSNAEIAEQLGVSKRTVTRYLKAARRPILPIDVAVGQLRREDFLELFLKERSVDSFILRHAMQLFLLKKMRHRKRRQFWDEAPEDVRLNATTIEGLFQDFVDGCSNVGWSS